MTAVAAMHTLLQQVGRCRSTSRTACVAMVRACVVPHSCTWHMHMHRLAHSQHAPAPNTAICCKDCQQAHTPIQPRTQVVRRQRKHLPDRLERRQNVGRCEHIPPVLLQRREGGVRSRLKRVCNCRVWKHLRTTEVKQDLTMASTTLPPSGCHYGKSTTQPTRKAVRCSPGGLPEGAFAPVAMLLAPSQAAYGPDFTQERPQLPRLNRVVSSIRAVFAGHVRESVQVRQSSKTWSSLNPREQHDESNSM